MLVLHGPNHEIKHVSVKCAIRLKNIKSQPVIYVLVVYTPISTLKLNDNNKWLCQSFALHHGAHYYGPIVGGSSMQLMGLGRTETDW